MRFFIISVLFISINNNLRCQDTIYARKVIKFLTSETCFGRGYNKDGLKTAEKYIIRQLKNEKVSYLFKNSFTQSFSHSVNTFSKKIDVKLNGLRLLPGIDFIIEPTSKTTFGKFLLEKIDSVEFINKNFLSEKINVKLKTKLTHSIGNKQSDFCRILIDKNKIKDFPKEIEINIHNKLISNFISKNIGCVISGKSNSDSMIIFSAHYDHLGGLGKSTFFPGANDNASGVSVLLNLIKFYTVEQPKYNSIFLFFAGEEAGLLGSKYFIESKVIDLKKIKFLINLDLLGTGEDGIMVVNGYLHEKEFNILNKINTNKNLLKEIKKRGKAANSDHYWFTESDVPSFFIYTLGGIAAYHDVYDVEKTLSLSAYMDVVNLLTEFVKEL